MLIQVTLNVSQNNENPNSIGWGSLNSFDVVELEMVFGLLCVLLNNNFVDQQPIRAVCENRQKLSRNLYEMVNEFWCRPTIASISADAFNVEDVDTRVFEHEMKDVFVKYFLERRLRQTGVIRVDFRDENEAVMFCIQASCVTGVEQLRHIFHSKHDRGSVYLE